MLGISGKSCKIYEIQFKVQNVCPPSHFPAGAIPAPRPYVRPLVLRCLSTAGVGKLQASKASVLPVLDVSNTAD